MNTHTHTCGIYIYIVYIHIWYIYIYILVHIQTAIEDHLAISVEQAPRARGQAASHPELWSQPSSQTVPASQASHPQHNHKSSWKSEKKQ